MDKAVIKECGDCNLLIYGDFININEITRDLGLKPTLIAEKGKPILRSGSSALGYCQTNGWFYSISFDDKGSFPNVLRLFLSQVSSLKSKLQMLVTKTEGTDIFITISVRSDYAQMSLEIAPELQKLISELGFPLRISILSFGMVGDDE